MSTHSLKISLSFIFIAEAVFPSVLKEIYLFHTTKEYKNNYKNTGFVPETLFFKLFGQSTAWQNTAKIEHQLCAYSLSDYYNPDLSEFAIEFLAYMDHQYNNAPETSEDNSTTKAQFPQAFAIMISYACHNWFSVKFAIHVKDYLLHREKHEKHVLETSKDANKYSWKPKPVPYLRSVLLTKRLEYDVLQSGEKKHNFYFINFFYFLKSSYEENEFLDDDFHYVLTRPEELMTHEISAFYNTLFGLKQWTPWFSNHMLTNK